MWPLPAQVVTTMHLVDADMIDTPVYHLHVHQQAIVLHHAIMYDHVLCSNLSPLFKSSCSHHNILAGTDRPRILLGNRY